MDHSFIGSASPASTLDIEQMPDTPRRGPYHRRAHSDTSFRFANFDDVLLFDPSDLDLSVLPAPAPAAATTITNNNAASSSSSAIPTPSPTDAPPHGDHMAVDVSSPSSAGGGNNSFPRPPGHPVGHLRSLSVDSDFLDGLGFNGVEGEKFGGNNTVVEKREFNNYRHRHSYSMDGSSPVSFEAESPVGFDGVKKALPRDRLAELALIDPKRAKRILANRQSAARSKERKIRYTNELERKVQMLQTEATNLSAQVTTLQKDTTGLTAENKELKMRLQAMEQQAKLRDALNEALREELHHLKLTTSRMAAVTGNPFNGRLPPQFSSAQPALDQFGSPPTQQFQQQLQINAPGSSSRSQHLSGHPLPDFSDFDQNSG